MSLSIGSSCMGVCVIGSDGDYSGEQKTKYRLP